MILSVKTQDYLFGSVTWESSLSVPQWMWTRADLEGPFQQPWPFENFILVYLNKNWIEWRLNCFRPLNQNQREQNYVSNEEIDYDWKIFCCQKSWQKNKVYLAPAGPSQEPQDPSLVSPPPCFSLCEAWSNGHILYVYWFSVYSKHCPARTINSPSNP